MLIRSAQLPVLIETLEREGEVAPAAAKTAKTTITQSRLPDIIDPLLELRRSLEGVVDERVIRRALKKAAVLVGSAKLDDTARAGRVGQAFLALARGAKEAASAEKPTVEPSSPYAQMSSADVDLLMRTPLRPVVEAARSKNLFVVLGEELDAKTQAEYERAFGLPIVGASGASGKGVAIHLGDIKSLGDAVPKGDLNPMLGDTSAQFWIEDNKWREYLIAKDFMPRTVNAADLLRDNPVFADQRQRVLELIEAYRANPTRASEAKVRRASHVLFQQFMALSKQLFPAGAFVKYIGEFQTGDKGQVIHTGKKRDAGRAFVSDLKAANEELGSRSRFEGKAMQAALADSERTLTHVLRSLLVNPSAVLAQEKMAIAKTRDGFNKEIRLDVVNGVVVNSSLRYGLDYAPDALERAAIFAQKFFDQASDEWKSMSAGVDVAVLENGELAIIEFNFGNQSGFMDPTDAPLEGSLFLSRLAGRPTPFIQRLQDAWAAGPEAQRRCISEIAAESPDKPDRALAAACYFRDRILERPDAHSAEALRALTATLAAIDPKNAPSLLAVSLAHLSESRA